MKDRIDNASIETQREAFHLKFTRLYTYDEMREVASFHSERTFGAFVYVFDLADNNIYCCVATKRNGFDFVAINSCDELKYTSETYGVKWVSYKVSVIDDYLGNAGYQVLCDRIKTLKEDKYSDVDCEESDEEDFDEDEEWDDSDEYEDVDEEDDPDDYIDDHLYDEPFSGSIRKEVYEYVTYIEQNLDKIENAMETIRNALEHIKFRY